MHSTNSAECDLFLVPEFLSDFLDELSYVLGLQSSRVVIPESVLAVVSLPARLQILGRHLNHKK